MDLNSQEPVPLKNSRYRHLHLNGSHTVEKETKIDICSVSPIERHYYILDSKSLGVCKYCNKVKQHSTMTFQEEYPYNKTKVNYD